MKRLFPVFLAALLLAGCKQQPAQTTAASTTQAPTTAVAETGFEETTAPFTGWLEENGQTFYFDPQGDAVTGWQEIDGSTYCFAEDGAMQTGWLEKNGYRHYLHSDGKAAFGKTEVYGVTYHFGPRGIEVLLVNPWNKVPRGYKTELVQFRGGYYVSQDCLEALEDMFTDCELAGCDPVLISGHRSRSYQEKLFDNKVQSYVNEGYKESYAKKLAAKSVAIPGTSEHQLGLAVDIIDNGHWATDASQADTPTQQWLMENCWEYGFILRYPIGSSEITGIIYEPWHYRYVGLEMARELRALGITLEEYVGATPEG